MFVSRPTILPDVLRLLDRGLAVFPVDVTTKQPAIEWGGFDAVLPTEEQVTNWFDGKNRAVGVAMGPVSGVWLLDFDFAKHPEARDFYESHQFPRTWSETTASGGLHLYFKWEDALDLKQTNTTSKLHLGVDTKGYGGYSKICPSPGYEWIVPPHLSPLAFAPDWLVEMLSNKDGKVIEGFAAKPDDWMIAELMGVQPGSGIEGRTPTFVRAIGRLKAKQLSANEVKFLLRPVAQQFQYDTRLDALVDDQFQRYPPKAAASDGTKLKNHSLKEARTTKKPVPFLVDTLIYENSINVLAGLGNSRKTWMLIDLAVALASGTPWMGKFKCRKSRVMLLDQERPGDEALRRIDAVTYGRGLDSDSLEGSLAPKLNIEPPFRLNMESSFQLFESVVADYRPDVILIDSLKASQNGNINHDQDMQGLFEKIKTIRLKYYTTFVILHHENKGSYERTREKRIVTAENIAGSAVIHEVPEGVFVAEDRGSESWFYHVKNNFGTKIAPFMVTVKDLVPDKSKIAVEAF